MIWKSRIISPQRFGKIKNGSDLWRRCSILRRRILWFEKSSKFLIGRYEKEGVNFAHEHGRKVYITLNIVHIMLIYMV